MDKNEILQQKNSIQMSLRNHTYIKSKKFKEYDQQQEQKYIQSKSKRWWYKVNKRYFASVTKHQLQCLRNTILEDCYLTLQNLTPKQQSYFARNVLLKNQKLFDKKNIKVLFQNDNNYSQQPQYFFFSYAFSLKQQEEQYDYDVPCVDLTENSDNGQQIPEKSTQNQPHDLFQTLKVMSMIENQRKLIQDNQVDKMASQIELDFIKSSSDTNFIQQCNYYDLSGDKFYETEIDRQISLWKEQLRKVTSSNNSAWQNIFCNLQKEQQKEKENTMIQKIKSGYDVEQDISKIQIFLQWQHNLLNFKYGFGQKNIEMLAEALQGMWVKQNKTKNMGQKKKFFKQSIQNLIITKSELFNPFQTDCKICFSTYVSQKNKVIYCDRCNQSFHQQCYGIQDLDEDPNSKFYCDACVDLIGQKDLAKDKKYCQICYVPQFPLKKFDDCFFHPSCLFLSNMLKSKIGKLQFIDGVTAQSICQDVNKYTKDNPHSSCEYCRQTHQKGFHFKCAQPQCNRKFHSICAYLNAASFKIWRNNQILQVQIRCLEHFPQRDHIRQIYLRRFFCNYKNASDLTEDELLQIYKEQIETISDFKRQQKQTKQLKRQIKLQRDSQIHLQKPRIKNTHKVKENSSRQTIVNHIIDLQSSSDLQKTNYYQNSCGTIPNKAFYYQNKNQKLSFSAIDLKLDLQKFSQQHKRSKQRQNYKSLQTDSFQKLKTYISRIDSKIDQLSTQSIKQDYYSQGDLNTNSNNFQNQSEKIILQ